MDTRGALTSVPRGRFGDWFAGFAAAWGGRDGQEAPNEGFAAALALAGLSRFASSPDAINALASWAPPINTPLTKIIGNVGQPVQIFNAVRRRHVLR